MLRFKNEALYAAKKRMGRTMQQELMATWRKNILLHYSVFWELQKMVVMGLLLGVVMVGYMNNGLNWWSHAALLGVLGLMGMKALDYSKHAVDAARMALKEMLFVYPNMHDLRPEDWESGQLTQAYDALVDEAGALEEHRNAICDDFKPGWTRLTPGRLLDAMTVYWTQPKVKSFRERVSAFQESVHDYKQLRKRLAAQRQVA